jgi:hypothetical protein
MAPYRLTISVFDLEFHEPENQEPESRKLSSIPVGRKPRYWDERRSHLTIRKMSEQDKSATIPNVQRSSLVTCIVQVRISLLGNNNEIGTHDSSEKDSKVPQPLPSISLTLSINSEPPTLAPNGLTIASTTIQHSVGEA